MPARPRRSALGMPIWRTCRRIVSSSPLGAVSCSIRRRRVSRSTTSSIPPRRSTARRCRARRASFITSGWKRARQEHDRLRQGGETMKMHPLLKGVVRGFSRMHTMLFRSLGATGPGAFRNTLILTTRGRRTGREVATPLLYVEDQGKLYIVASFGGNDAHPGWYLNLTAHPEVK